MKTYAWLALVLLLGGCAGMSAIPPSSDLAPIGTLGGIEPSSRTWDPDAQPRQLLRPNDADALLVRPLVNGEAIGWFVLDSGATGMTITKKGAQLAGLEAVGRVKVESADTTVYQGDTLQLGQLTMHRPRFAGLNLPFSQMVLGQPVVGICGYDLFNGSLVEIDIEAGSIGVYGPERVAPEWSGWTDLTLVTRLPHVRLAFDGGEGNFLIDTGYAGDVWFFGPAVREYDLLNDRSVRRRTMVGLERLETVWEGELNWVELGGHRLESLQGTFSNVDGEAWGTAAAIGMIGRGLLARFVVVFDYRNGRIALIPRL